MAMDVQIIGDSREAVALHLFDRLAKQHVEAKRARRSHGAGRATNWMVLYKSAVRCRHRFPDSHP